MEEEEEDVARAAWIGRCKSLLRYCGRWPSHTAAISTPTTSVMTGAPWSKHWSC